METFQIFRYPIRTSARPGSGREDGKPVSRDLPIPGEATEPGRKKRLGGFGDRYDCRHYWGFQAKSVDLRVRTISPADLVVNEIIELVADYSGYFREQNEEAKAKKLQDIKTINNPYYLAKFEEIVKRNGGYFVGEQVMFFVKHHT